MMRWEVKNKEDSFANREMVGVIGKALILILYFNKSHSNNITQCIF